MNKLRTLVDKNTGKICGKTYNTKDQIKPGFFVTDEIIDREKYFLDTKTSRIEERPCPGITIDKTTIHPDGKDMIHIGNIPIGAELSVWVQTNKGFESVVTYIIKDGTFNFSMTVPGSYKILIQSFPNKLFETFIFARMGK